MVSSLMYTEDAFNAAIRELAELNGLDLETAGNYMVLIGDCPMLAEDDRVVVQDKDGNELARVWWTAEDE